MILRDPVHGLVSFEGDQEEVIMALLATPEVQRLRRVTQLGLTSLVFPGAEHSRFAHALGAAHVMVRLQQRVALCQQRLPVSMRLDRESSRDALGAALLHDLGHGPFSHLFEDVLPKGLNHEQWTKRILEDPDTEVHRALSALDPQMPGSVVRLLSHRHRLGWLSRTLSGTLDVDRADYLLRDSHMTGVGYGHFDLDWLLKGLTFAQTEGPSAEWVLAIEGRKGLPPIEAFFLARHNMYGQVYHHKATRAAESLIRGMFRRLAELIRDGRSPAGTPAAVEAAVLGEEIEVAEYLRLDDALLTSCFALWEHSKDPILADFAGRLRRRCLPKTVPLPEGEGAQAGWKEAHRRACEIADRRGLRPDLWVWLDIPHDVPYREPKDDSPNGLWVALRHQPLLRLGDASFVLRHLRNRVIERPRLIFPAEIRTEVEAAIDGIWS